MMRQPASCPAISIASCWIEKGRARQWKRFTLRCWRLVQTSKAVEYWEAMEGRLSRTRYIGDLSCCWATECLFDTREANDGTRSMADRGSDATRCGGHRPISSGIADPWREPRLARRANIPNTGGFGF